MTTQNVTIPALSGGSFSAYLATPSTQPDAGIMLIQEILGVNTNMRQIADDYAKSGYLVLVPDLYWRLEPGVQLDADDKDQWAKGFELLQAFDVDSGVEDLKASLSFLRQYPSSTGKVGSVGFCLGGKLAYFMATRTDANANVSYYGVDIDKNLAEATKIQKPLILHLGENDEFVSLTAQASIQQGLKDNPLVTIYRYEGVSHGFSRVGSSTYRKEAAELAHDRTLAFLKQHLGSGVKV
ncbi:dienelactone hydrolase family protein [Nostoc sp. 'Peltigera malacea cyanobiont' DB3992]|uniref:dienelactone hydrolase family protein n=1 Tax=Nostoc sp. 'Peltigera malacea cyanobiont' DB3992 TaxID=1206980 RepID=UPI000C051F45|nr:dienelactone hydrolase family protein [Nostoc sp. 'Peltigera malacea cyanobiont' DB3992]PHM06743.1 carboxymethylenebutenolidase [Nostoc sp. 'Peltigera malacea cyanobiont' DB3992]